MNIKEKIKYYFVENSAFIFSTPAIMWQMLFLYMPLLIVVYMSLKINGSSCWYAVTLAHYKALLAYDYLKIITNL